MCQAEKKKIAPYLNQWKNNIKNSNNSKTHIKIKKSGKRTEKIKNEQKKKVNIAEICWNAPHHEMWLRAVGSRVHPGGRVAIVFQIVVKRLIKRLLVIFISNCC